MHGFQVQSFAPPDRTDGKRLSSAAAESLGDVPMRTRSSISHGAFIVDNPGCITELYDFGKTNLGQGAYGTVCKATHNVTGVPFAVKCIGKAQSGAATLAALKLETNLMRTMDHPNIVKLFESFEDYKYIYLVMELCLGGELFDRITSVGHFSEVQVALLMRQIFTVIHYMHHQKVVHRDLKPENFLFASDAPIDRSTLKLIDFGLSKQLESDEQVLTTKAGTPYYIAPQVLQGKYDKSCDIWSCGVIMYVLLCGYPPFYGESNADVLKRVKKGIWSFDVADWRGITESAKNLIRNCIKMNPKERFKSEAALNHTWVQRKAPGNKGSLSLPNNFVENLRRFKSANQLKKATLHLIAHQMDEQRILQLRDVFHALDTDHDGMLTPKEMKKGLEKSLKEMPQDFRQIFEQLDTSCDGSLNYTEFIAASLDLRMYSEEHTIWSAFRFFDKDGSGKISREEIAQVLTDGGISSLVEEELIDDVMKEVDADGDGEIDFEEFMHMMRGNSMWRKKTHGTRASISSIASESIALGDYLQSIAGDDRPLKSTSFFDAKISALRHKARTMRKLTLDDIIVSEDEEEDEEEEDEDQGEEDEEEEQKDENASMAQTRVTPILTRANSLFSDEEADEEPPAAVEKAAPATEHRRHRSSHQVVTRADSLLFD